MTTGIDRRSREGEPIWFRIVDFLVDFLVRNRFLNMVRHLNWFVLFIGFLSGAIGVAGILEGPIPYPRVGEWLSVIHQEVASELVGAGFAILVIDTANRWATLNEEKARLRLQLASEDIAISRDTLRILSKRWWLIDGTLRGAPLYGVNWENEHLYAADFQNASLVEAKLKGISLEDANLRATDLTRADLQKAKLRWTNLQGAQMREANLQEADLTRASLAGAGLWDANLKWARLKRTDFQGAQFLYANLQGADLREVNLPEADLRGADLRAAHLRAANLRKAELDRADLRWSIFRGADLQEARLPDVKLRGAVLVGANLQRADLEGAHLQEADLKRANLQGADLSYANLQGARGLTCDQLGQARTLQAATLPDGNRLPNGYDTWRSAFEAWCELLAGVDADEHIVPMTLAHNLRKLKDDWDDKDQFGNVTDDINGEGDQNDDD